MSCCSACRKSLFRSGWSDQLGSEEDSLGSLGLCRRWTERFTSRVVKSAALVSAYFPFKRGTCTLWLLFGSGGFMSGAEKGQQSLSERPKSDSGCGGCWRAPLLGVAVRALWKLDV